MVLIANNPSITVVMTSPDEIFRDFADIERAQEYYDDHNRTRGEVDEENLGPLIDEFLNGRHCRVSQPE